MIVELDRVCFRHDLFGLSSCNLTSICCTAASDSTGASSGSRSSGLSAIGHFSSRPKKKLGKSLGV